MGGSRIVESRTLLLLSIALASVSCTIDVPPSETAAPKAFVSSLFRETSETRVPIDSPLPAPERGEPATFVHFHNGWSGAARLPDSGRTKCTDYPRSGDRYFQAWSSDFAMFDRGSGYPGEDFSIEVWVPGERLIALPIDENAVSIYVTTVAIDGTHRTVRAWGSAETAVVLSGDEGVGFSILARPDNSTAAVAATGFIACDDAT